MENNPLTFSDPTGHCKGANAATQCLVDGAGGVDGTVASAAELMQTAEAFMPGFMDKYTNVDYYGKFFGNVASVTPGVGDIVDVVDTGAALYHGDGAGALTNVGLALLPGSTRFWKGAGEFIGRNADEFVNGVQALGRLCSFSADTLVMTEDGLVPISEVTLETLVLAYNEETGEIGYYPVVAIWSHEDPVIVFLTIDGETIVTTPEHPFFTSAGEWEQAANLQRGDEIRDAAWGTGTVETITFTVTPQIMYNFTVATAHTYFVGDGQWLVHNTCGNKGIFDQLVDQAFADSDDAIEMALDFLGDYNEIDTGVFRSIQPLDIDASGNPIFAQVRITTSDLVGHKGGPSHMNFELWTPETNGRWAQIGNKHVNLTDP